MTNAEFASTDKDFLEACTEAKVKPTSCQASKWRRKMGLAWNVHTKKVGGRAGSAEVR